MKRNSVKTYLKNNYVRLVPALVIAVAAGGLGFTYLVQSFAADAPVKITNTVQNLTLGGPPVDANTSALASNARVGDSLQYSISVTNTSPKGIFGGNELTGVKVTDGIQQGVEYSANPAAKTVSIDYGTIPAGTSITRKFEVKVLASASSTVMQNMACYTTTAQFFKASDKGCDTAFTRVASATTVVKSANPKPVAKAAAPAATPTPSPATPPAATAADCKGATDATVKAGSAGADFVIPTPGASAVQVSYGLDSSNLDSKSSLTPATGTSTTAILTNLKPGSTYSYQVIRQCSDGEYKSSETSTFSTEKMHVNVVFQNDDNDPLEGITSTANCADGDGGKSDSTGLGIFNGVTSGDCKLTYSYDGKECSNALPVPQPGLSGEKSAADSITLTYKIKACADQTPTGDPSNTSAKSAASSKIAIGLGILVAILAALLIRSFIKHRGGGSGDSTGMTGGSDSSDGFVPPVDIPPAPDDNADVSGGDTSADTDSLYDSGEEADSSLPPEATETSEAPLSPDSPESSAPASTEQPVTFYDTPDSPPPVGDSHPEVAPLSDGLADGEIPHQSSEQSDTEDGSLHIKR